MTTTKMLVMVQMKQETTIIFPEGEREKKNAYKQMMSIGELSEQTNERMANKEESAKDM